MTDTGPQQPPIATLTADPPDIRPGHSDAGTILIVGVLATNTSGRLIAESEIALWTSATGGAAESSADSYQPWWAIQPGEQVYIGGQLQVDPGDWQVRVQVVDAATSTPILDFPVQTVHVDGPATHQTPFDDTQQHLVSVFIDSAEAMGLECRIHYTITNATEKPVPAGMKVTGLLIGDDGGFSSEVYHYTEPLPPYAPQARYLTLELVDLTAGGGATATARIIVDPSGPSEVSDEVKLTFNGTGPVTMTR